MLYQSSCQLYVWTHCVQVAALEGCGQLLPVLQALEDATALPELPSQAWLASQPALGGLRPSGQGRARWYPTGVAARRSAGCQAALLRALQSAVQVGWSPLEAAEVSGHFTGRDSSLCLVVALAKERQAGLCQTHTNGAASGAGQAGPSGSAALEDSWPAPAASTCPCSRKPGAGFPQPFK